VRADGTTRHGRPENPGAAGGESSAASWPPGRADQTEPGQASGRSRGTGPRPPQPPAEPFKWGRRRWDAAPHEAESAEYDARADKTKLFDAEGSYLGWMDGDPYELADETGAHGA
jgi:hypothetical protein